MRNDIEKILYTEEQINDLIKSLGAKISEDYAGKNPIIISVLKGSFIFMADLVRNIDIPCEVDFMAVSSYGAGTTSSGEVRIINDLSKGVEGRDVIIVEDILDSGVTLNYLIGVLETRGANSLEICTFLSKPDRRKVDVNVKYEGYTIPDEFVVGYGLDYAEKYRNLPYLGILKPSVYTN